MPRVVADSNVIISAFHRGGHPLRVLLRARAGDCALSYSPFILDEVVRILTSPKFAWPIQQVHEAITSLPGQLIVPAGRLLHVVSDETDNRVVECAVAARAHFLVTGDRHLLDLSTYFRTRILTPKAFLDVL